MKFHEQLIRVKSDSHNPSKEQEIMAQVALGTGLAYHKTVTDGIDEQTFTITHIPSGYRVFSGRFLAEQNAKRFIMIISVLCDWNQPQADLVAYGRERMKSLLDDASDLACVVLRDGKPDMLSISTNTKKEKTA